MENNYKDSSIENETFYVIRIEIKEPNKEQYLYKELIYETMEEADKVTDAILEHINGTGKYVSLVDSDHAYMFYPKEYGKNILGVFTHGSKKWKFNELTSEIDKILNT